MRRDDHIIKLGDIWMIAGDRLFCVYVKCSAGNPFFTESINERLSSRMAPLELLIKYAVGFMRAIISLLMIPVV